MTVEIIPMIEWKAQVQASVYSIFKVKKPGKIVGLILIKEMVNKVSFFYHILILRSS